MSYIHKITSDFTTGEISMEMFINEVKNSPITHGLFTVTKTPMQRGRYIWDINISSDTPKPTVSLLSFSMINTDPAVEAVSTKTNACFNNRLAPYLISYMSGPGEEPTHIQKNLPDGLQQKNAIEDIARLPHLRQVVFSGTGNTFFDLNPKNDNPNLHCCGSITFESNDLTFTFYVPTGKGPGALYTFKQPKLFLVENDSDENLPLLCVQGLDAKTGVPSFCYVSTIQRIENFDKIQFFVAAINFCMNAYNREMNPRVPTEEPSQLIRTEPVLVPAIIPNQKPLVP